MIPYRPHAPEACRVAPLIDGLHPQEAFHHDRYRVPFRAALAGTGAGKTAAGAFELISWMLENPGCVCLAGEPDFPMVGKIMIPAIEDLIGSLDTSPLVKSWNKNEHCLKLMNGAVCWFISCEKPEKIEGPNVDFGWLDEIRLIRHWERTWRNLRRRIRGSKPGMRTGAIVSTHSPTKEQMDEFEGPSRKPGRRCYRWSIFDNPLLGEDYLREMEASHSGPARKAALFGEWAQAEGRVFSEFQLLQHVVPRPDSQIPERSREYQAWTERMSYGVDWGHGLPAALIACAWGGEIAHLIDEFYGVGYSVEELAQAAVDMEARWGPGTWYCGHDRPEHIKTFQRFGLKAVSIQSVRGAFQKMDGISVMNSMFKSDEFRVAPECAKWLWEEERYLMKPEKDETEKGHDHAMDASRYAVMGARARTRLSFGSVSRR